MVFHLWIKIIEYSWSIGKPLTNCWPCTVPALLLWCISALLPWHLPLHWLAILARNTWALLLGNLLAVLPGNLRTFLSWSATKIYFNKKLLDWWLKLPALLTWYIHALFFWDLLALLPWHRVTLLSRHRVTLLSGHIGTLLSWNIVTHL